MKATVTAAQPWPAFDIYVQRGWAAFGWYAISFPRWVYNVIVAAMLAVGALCAVAVWRERLAARRRGFELIVLILVAVGVLAAIEAAFYTTTGGRTVVSEQGRYVFPAIIPIAAVAVGGAYAFGRNRAAPILGGLVAAVLVISFAGQWLTLLGFYA